MDDSDANRDVLVIHQVFASWYAAMENGDVDTLISLVTSDVVFKPPDVAPIVGRNALRQALADFLGAHSETVDYDVLEVEVSDQLAFARLHERALVRPKTGEDPSSFIGIHLTVLRRQPGGEWLIAREISSLVSQQPPGVS